MMNVGSNWASYQKSTPLQVVRKKSESQSVVMSSHWKKSQDSLRVFMMISGGWLVFFKQR